MTIIDLSDASIETASRLFYEWLCAECDSWGLDSAVEVGLLDVEPTAEMEGGGWKVSCESGPEDWARALCAGKSLYFFESEGGFSDCEVVFDEREYLLWTEFGWELTFYRWNPVSDEDDEG